MGKSYLKLIALVSMTNNCYFIRNLLKYEIKVKNNLKKWVEFMWEDFKKFAFEGNLIDLAVAVIIGGAFGQIVSSLVEDIIVPLIGILLNGVNIEHLVILVGSAELRYGVFLQSVLDFFIIALSIFLFLRFILKRKNEEEEEVEEDVSKEEELLTEIRDLLKEQNNQSQ